MPPAHDNHTPQMTQAAQQSFGTFSSPAFASIGDPYQKKANPLSRHKGRQFQTNPVNRAVTPGRQLRRGVQIKLLHQRGETAKTEAAIMRGALTLTVRTEKWFLQER